MKAIKILIIALVATFAFNTVKAQTTAPTKATTETPKKVHKKGHKKHHHKKHVKMAPAKM